MKALKTIPIIVLLLCVVTYAQIKVSLSMPGNRRLWINKNMLCHHPLTEGGAARLFDLAQRNHYGTLGSGAEQPSWILSDYGSALNFDGGDYYEIAGSDTGDLQFDTSDLSIVLWIKRGSIGTTQTMLGTRRTDTNRGFGFGFSDVNRLQFAIYGFTIDYGDGTYTDTSSWHQVAVTYDHEYVRYYWDGRPDGSDARTQDIVPSTFPVYVGARNDSDSAASHFSGAIASVMIYNRVLSPREIAQLHVNLSLPQFEDETVRWYYEAENIVPILVNIWNN